MRVIAPALIVSAVVGASPARADDPPPPAAAQPPPGYAPPPAGYGPAPGYPPPGYAPPPGYPAYGYPPAVYVQPAELPYREGQPIPPGYQVESQARRGLVIAGSVTFGVTYGLSVLTAVLCSSGSGADCGLFAIPVAGPSIWAADHAETGIAGTVVWGVAQGAGLTMLIVGLAARQEKLVWVGTSGQTAKVTPVVGRDASGVGVVGTF